MTRVSRLFAGALAACAATSSGSPAQAQDYPNRVIHFMVGFAAGGGNDLFARLVVNKFQQNTGANAIVENKVGAGGRIARRIFRARGARWLHGAGRRQRADVDCLGHLSQTQLSPDQELHRAQHDRVVPAGAGGGGG
ncbi:MAG: hypothetical protein WDN48_03655 [Pseudolabrys sp.]